MFKCHMLLGVAAIFELALTQNSYWIRVRHKKIYKLFFIRDESTHEPSQFQLKLNSFSYRARLARAKLTKVILVQAKLARVWTEPRPNFFVSSHLKLERSGLLYKSTLLTTIKFVICLRLIVVLLDLGFIVELKTQFIKLERLGLLYKSTLNKLERSGLLYKSEPTNCWKKLSFVSFLYYIFFILKSKILYDKIFKFELYLWFEHLKYCWIKIKIYKICVPMSLIVTCYKTHMNSYYKVAIDTTKLTIWQHTT
jgi:hypothetical protein